MQWNSLTEHSSNAGQSQDCLTTALITCRKENRNARCVCMGPADILSLWRAERGHTTFVCEYGVGIGLITIIKRRVVIVFHRCNFLLWNLWAISVQSIHRLFLSSLILSSHSGGSLVSNHLIWEFPNKFLYLFLVSHKNVLCFSHSFLPPTPRRKDVPIGPRVLISKPRPLPRQYLIICKTFTAESVVASLQWGKWKARCVATARCEWVGVTESRYW
jgi:hypothetical protein